MKHEYELAGMHCQSCVGKIKAALESVAGVSSAEVVLNPPQARVEMTRHIPIKELDKAVRDTGDYRLKEKNSATATSTPDEGKSESLFPLVLIVGYIAGTVAVVAIASGDSSAHALMRHFMAGFFLVFSFFKLLNLRGFADAYRSYDPIAKAWPIWGFTYPFAELSLGVAYLLNVSAAYVNLATLALMLTASVGVLKTLLNNRAIRCACLGTVLNLPMTKITLVEDLGMAAMAAVMLATL